MGYIAASAVRIDDSVLRKRMGAVAKLFPGAVADAMNHLAFSTRKVERAAMATVFDRPTPFVLNGLRLAQKATPQVPVAAIWFKDVFGKFGDVLENTIRPHIEGGRRRVKASEKRLRVIGVLKPGEWLTYAADKTNAYGNLSGPEHQRMLAYFGAYWEAGYSGNRVKGGKIDRAGVRYIVNRTSTGGRAIYKVRGRRGRPRLMWHITSDTPTYRRRFRFYEIANEHARRAAPRIADKAVRQALARAL